ncbi:MAG TPA: LuxR C-terminal-related transcriptional regulator [Thermodesulfobacteriota bacterium]|nr:LuxR C-terminal-related transcriptional regulator [Thermodesulfobacteriota bacterium]
MASSVFLKLDSLKEHDRICHLYSNNVERLEVGANFILHGIRNKEKCLYISDRALPKEFVYRLKGSGMDVNTIALDKQFEEVNMSGKQRENWEDPQSFVNFIKPKVESAWENGQRVRVLRSKVSLPYSHTNLLWREALLDKFCSEKPIILMSQFDIGRISSQDSVSLFKTHPLVILDNIIYESSFYTSPDDILSKVQGEYNTYASLTSKEKTILRYIVNGYSNRSIAKELSISVKTVETHRANIMRKLDVNKLVDLVKFAIRNRIV